MTRGCIHLQAVCLNPHEFIRKYKCIDCGEVMMCSCDESFARRFLPHQLDRAVVLDTQERVPVTLGFQAGVCRSCRGLPEEPHPKSESHKRGSKVVRYYWREIYFETTERFAAWATASARAELTKARAEFPEEYSRIRREVVEEIKAQHAGSPKYEYREESQAEIIAKYGVEVVPLEGEYAPSQTRGALLKRGGDLVSPEEFATCHFEERGWSVIKLESRPLHALFGVLMFLLIQDIADPRGRVVGFGDREAYEEGRESKQIMTRLPEDFGSTGYADRRRQAIEEHLATLPGDTDELLDLFDYWVAHSAELRQYLWAHRSEVVDRARTLIRVLAPDVVLSILRHLAGHYWGRYLGWPDLLVYKGSEYFLAEVKSSKDKLREDQKSWIRDNSQNLKLPFKLVKIHRMT